MLQVQILPRAQLGRPDWRNWQTRSVQGGNVLGSTLASGTMVNNGSRREGQAPTGASGSTPTRRACKPFDSAP